MIGCVIDTNVDEFVSLSDRHRHRRGFVRYEEGSPQVGSADDGIGHLPVIYIYQPIRAS